MQGRGPLKGANIGDRQVVSSITGFKRFERRGGGLEEATGSKGKRPWGSATDEKKIYAGNENRWARGCLSRRGKKKLRRVTVTQKK